MPELLEDMMVAAMDQERVQPEGQMPGGIEVVWAQDGEVEDVQANGPDHVPEPAQAQLRGLNDHNDDDDSGDEENEAEDEDDEVICLLTCVCTGILSPHLDLYSPFNLCL